MTHNFSSQGFNGVCGPQKFLEACGKRGNLLAKILAENWHDPLPQVIPFSNTTDVQLRSQRSLGATGKGVARNLIPQMLKDRFGNNKTVFNAKIDATLTEVVDLVAAFPRVWEFAALHRISYTQNVDDQAIDVQRLRTVEDTSGTTPRTTSTEYTISSLGCPTGSRVTTLALVFDSVDMAGVGLPIPVVATFGPTIQTLAAFVADGQINPASDTFTGPEGAGIQITSLNASHNWMNQIFQGMDLLQDPDMSEQEHQYLQQAKAEYQNMVAELKGMQQQYSAQLQAAGMQQQQNGLFTHPNGGPQPAPNGYKMDNNGLYQPEVKRRVFIAKNGKNGSEMQKNGSANQPKNGGNGLIAPPPLNGNRIAQYLPAQQQPSNMQFIPPAPPAGQYGMYYPNGHPQPVNFPYPYNPYKQ